MPSKGCERRLADEERAQRLPGGCRRLVCSFGRVILAWVPSKSPVVSSRVCRRTEDEATSELRGREKTVRRRQGQVRVAEPLRLRRRARCVGRAFMKPCDIRSRLREWSESKFGLLFKARHRTRLAGRLSTTHSPLQSQSKKCPAEHNMLEQIYHVANASADLEQPGLAATSSHQRGDEVPPPAHGKRKNGTDDKENEGETGTSSLAAAARRKS